MPSSTTRERQLKTRAYILLLRRCINAYTYRIWHRPVLMLSQPLSAKLSLHVFLLMAPISKWVGLIYPPGLRDKRFAVPLLPQAAFFPTASCNAEAVSTRRYVVICQINGVEGNSRSTWIVVGFAFASSQRAYSLSSVSCVHVVRSQSPQVSPQSKLTLPDQAVATI